VLANRLRWGGDTGSLGLSIDDYERRNKPFDELFAELRRDRVEIIDLPAVLCDGEFCPVRKDRLSLYWDGNHLSEQGAKYVKPAFATLIDHLSRTKKGSGTISRKF
jgi:hypothetical protein